MKEETIKKAIDKAIEKQEQEKKFEFEVDKKIEGSLFLRTNGKAEFFPRLKREKGGMSTTNKTDAYTIQESQKRVKITLSFEKASITFNEVLRQVSKLVKTLQNMKIV